MKVFCTLLSFPFSPLLWSCGSTGLHLLPGAIWLPWWIFMDNKVVTVFHRVLLMLIPKPEIYLGIDRLVSWDRCVCLSLLSSLTWLEKLLEGGDLGRPAQILSHIFQEFMFISEAVKNYKLKNWKRSMEEITYFAWEQPTNCRCFHKLDSPIVVSTQVLLSVIDLLNLSYYLFVKFIRYETILSK